MQEETLTGIGESTDANKLLEQVGVKITPYISEEVPERYTGIKQVVVRSRRGFVAILDGVRRRGFSLEIRHPRPLTVYGIEGVERATYMAPEDSKFPSGDATEIRLSPRRASFSVTGYETPVDETRLDSITASQTVYREKQVYRDPRTVKVNGRDFPNIKTVRVENLRDAEVILYAR